MNRKGDSEVGDVIKVVIILFLLGVLVLAGYTMGEKVLEFLHSGQWKNY